MYTTEDIQKIIDSLERQGFIVTGNLLIQELKKLDADALDTKESDNYDLNTHPHA